ncbi:hypothetical protein KAR91_88480 [Candidatus Pacearchaeota archaeon]|nr:hypothetical protein [Candidatus Pacearchaeota archaeon]
MSSKDMQSKIDELVALNTQLINTDTTTVGNIIDTQDFESVEFIIQEGVKTLGDVTPILEDGDDSGLSDAAVVASDFRLGSLVTLNATNAITRVGYVGKKRYIRLSVLSANSANLTVGGTVILGHPRQSPVSQ